MELVIGRHEKELNSMANHKQLVLIKLNEKIFSLFLEEFLPDQDTTMNLSKINISVF